MEENRENPIRNGEQLVIKDEKGRFMAGSVPNPNGRPKGSRDFYTDFKEAIQRIKDKNTGEELTEMDIIKIGLEKMLKGDARFEGLYKDLLDRVYGRPMQRTDITTNEKDLPTPLLNVILNNDSNKENIEVKEEN